MITKLKVSKNLWSTYNTIDQTTQYFLFDLSVVEKEDIFGIQFIFLWFHFIISA